jgi:hypothetical protein
MGGNKSVRIIAPRFEKEDLGLNDAGGLDPEGVRVTGERIDDDEESEREPIDRSNFIIVAHIDGENELIITPYKISNPRYSTGFTRGDTCHTNHRCDSVELDYFKKQPIMVVCERAISNGDEYRLRISLWEIGDGRVNEVGEGYLHRRIHSKAARLIDMRILGVDKIVVVTKSSSDKNRLLIFQVNFKDYSINRICRSFADQEGVQNEYGSLHVFTSEPNYIVTSSGIGNNRFCLYSKILEGRNLSDADIYGVNGELLDLIISNEESHEGTIKKRYVIAAIRHSQITDLPSLRDLPISHFIFEENVRHALTTLIIKYWELKENGSFEYKGSINCFDDGEERGFGIISQIGNLSMEPIFHEPFVTQSQDDIEIPIPRLNRNRGLDFNNSTNGPSNETNRKFMKAGFVICAKACAFTLRLRKNKKFLPITLLSQYERTIPGLKVLYGYVIEDGKKTIKTIEGTNVIGSDTGNGYDRMDISSQVVTSGTSHSSGVVTIHNDEDDRPYITYWNYFNQNYEYSFPFNYTPKTSTSIRRIICVIIGLLFASPIRYIVAYARKFRDKFWRRGRKEDY